MHTTRLALLTVLGALAAAASLAPAASAADQRYASPAGSGDACTAASPCEITKAINGATAGAEVIVNPGDYPLTEGLYVPSQVTLRGVAGRPRPRVLLNGQNQVTMYESSMLRYVEIDQTTPSSHALYSLSAARLDQVVVKAAAGTYCAVRTYSGTIRNSVVVAPGSGTSAICADTGAGTSTNSYRNVTAIATGSGVAIEAYAAGSAKVSVSLLNVIARSGAGGVGLLMHTGGVGAEATITASRTNFASYSTSGNAHFVNGGANQGTPPHFVDVAAGNYRQAPGSVTIDAGLDDENSNGAFDIDGDPRKIGATDIGADEFVLAPAVTTGAAGAVTDRSATLSGSVNPSGAPTGYHFEHGPTTAYGSTTPTAAAGSGGAATAGLGGLSPATTYHYRIVATNAGGITKGADRTFTTLPAPAAPSTTSPTPPAQHFAGVELVSRKLIYARRVIAVRLRCPAGTVERCAGRTKLTARPQRTSTRRVTLGRASFSIAAGGRTTVHVRVTRAARRLLNGVPRLRGRAVNVARDGASQSKTTTAAVTIRRRHR